MRQAPNAGHGRRCVAGDRWQLLPNIPCTGIEDRDPACTGAEGEVWWQYAWEEGLKRGFPRPGHGGGRPEWALVMASPLWRSHQQMHIHIGSLAEEGMPLVDAFRKGDLGGRGGCISADPRAPSIRTLKVNEDGGRKGATTPVTLISVFAAARSAPEIASKVRPFHAARAAAGAAHACAAGIPYMLIVTARSQPLRGCGGGAEEEALGGTEPGFVVTVMLYGNQRWLLAEIDTDDCYKVCPLPPGPHEEWHVTEAV